MPWWAHADAEEHGWGKAAATNIGGAAIGTEAGMGAAALTGMAIDTAVPGVRTAVGLGVGAVVGHFATAGLLRLW